MKEIIKTIILVGLVLISYPAWAGIDFTSRAPSLTKEEKAINDIIMERGDSVADIEVISNKTGLSKQEVVQIIKKYGFIQSEFDPYIYTAKVGSIVRTKSYPINRSVQ